MKHNLFHLSRRYQNALRTHLKGGVNASLVPARGLGREALAAGLQTLDLAKLHEQTLIADLLPHCLPQNRGSLIKQAGIFFAAAISPIESTHRNASVSATHLKKSVEALSQRTVELAASNEELNLEITQRRAIERALKKSERHYLCLLEQSDRQQKHLRLLSRQLLSAQEDERKKISRDLHDVVAQTLTGINIRLATLKKEAAVNAKGIEQNITLTQALVEKSVNLVHRFARELRPAVLDDLGLIPALHSFMKNFTEQTGIRTHLTAFSGIELIDMGRRTVLFRIAQEALTNVSRHAQASRVDVTIEELPLCTSMEIKDDGKSFRVQRTLQANRGKRLGLIGMRERLEMVGGNFSIESAPGQGTTIRAQIPLGKDRVRQRNSSTKNSP